MKRTWVHDEVSHKASLTIAKYNWWSMGRRPKGAIYMVGNSKCGKPDMVGIYFEDPTHKSRFERFLQRIFGEK